jgi:hypothetical protein
MERLYGLLESQFVGLMCTWYATFAICEQIGMKDWHIIAVPFAGALAYYVATKDRQISN